MSDRSRLRLLVLQVLIVSLMLTLFGRLFFLQVVSGEQYQRAAADNRTREVVTPAVRGLILDSQGRPLAQNRTTIVVSVDRTAVGKQKDDGAAVIKRLSKTLGMRESKVKGSLTLCGSKGAAKAPVCWNGSPYQPIPIAKDVSTDVALSIMERRELYPGVTAELSTVRDYPAPGGAKSAHVLGYLGPVSDKEYSDGSSGFRRTDLIGRAGLEATYDTYLRGIPGFKSLAVNNAGSVTGTVETQDATPGDYVVTNLDARVQSVAEKALKTQIMAARAGKTYNCDGGCRADSGSVVVLNAKTGAVVAMASYPSYDPNVWVGGVSQKEYRSLTDPSSNTPLLSRAWAGEYIPASTFKVISTAAAVRAGESVNSLYECAREYKVGNLTKKNFESEAFGPITIRRAIEVSCNTVFYGLGYDAWVRDGGLSPKAGGADEWFVKTARDFGLGSLTNVDLPGERPGRVVDRADVLKRWKDNKATYCKRAKTGYPEIGDRTRARLLTAFAKENCVDGGQYKGGFAADFAIGQGETAVTPLQMATVYAAIANGGTLWEPQVAKAVISPSGKVVKKFEPKANGKIPVDKATLQYIQRSLRGVATNGTSKGLFTAFPVAVSAQTGSGQVTGKDDTSWFVSYAPSNNPQYVVVMMVSQGGTGAGTSGPGVKKIYQALFGVKGSSASPSKSVLPGGRLPTALPTIGKDGSIKRPAVAKR